MNESKPSPISGLRHTFRRFASCAASAMGTPWAFMLACLTIVVWAAAGPFYHFSEVWQMVINTSTTIVTFLMIFLLQNTQNRDSQAIQLKLDELIHAVQGARNKLVDLEDATDEELEALRKEFSTMSKSDENTDQTEPTPAKA